MHSKTLIPLHELAEQFHHNHHHHHHNHHHHHHYFNFLKTVAHLAMLDCKGPSIYKIKAKSLRKKEVHISKSTF